MASTYVNDLRLNEMATGDQSGSWGTVTNTNLELIAEAFSFGTEGITTNADTHTTTIADGATDPGRSMFLKYTGTLDSACTITIAPNTVSKLWFIENGTSGSQNIIIKQGSGATITIPPGDTKAIYSDGAGSGGKMVDAFASLSVVDLKVQDDLTVTDDVAIGGLATVGETLAVTGVLTTTAKAVSNGGIGMPDDAKLTFGGTGTGDLQIYHDGSNSYIDDAGAGDLRIRGENLQLADLANKNYVTCVSDGAVGLRFNDAQKLATTNTGIDVTGTVTADGLTAIVAGSTGDIATFGLSGNTNNPSLIVKGDATNQILTFRGGSNSSTYPAIAFDTGTGGEKLRIDSIGNVGIGTTSIDVSTQAGGSGYKALQIESDEGGQLNFDHNDAGTASTLGQINFQRAGEVVAEIEGVTDGATDNGRLAFRTQPNGGALTERVRIDHDGNVFVGGTSYEGSTTSNASSLAILSTGFISANVTDDFGMQVNRTGDNGKLLNFRKNGADVGSIGYQNTGFVIDGEAGHAGLRFAGNEISPRDNGSDVDNTVDLGESDKRFKDAYLSGGVFLGGTVAANKLDDYEEGSWTATLLGASSNPTVGYVIQTCFYTKVGSVVSLFIRLQINSISSGGGVALIAGMPFAHNTGRAGGAVGYASGVNLDSGFSQFGFSGDVNASTIRFVQSGDNVGAQVVNIDQIGASTDVLFTYTYSTSA